MVLWEMVDVTVEQKHKNRKAKDEEFREIVVGKATGIKP